MIHLNPIKEHKCKKFAGTVLVSLIVLGIILPEVTGTNIVSWTYVTGMPIRGLQMDENGTLVIVAVSNSYNGSVYGFNSQGHILWKYTIPSRIESISTPRDSKYTAVGAKGYLYIIDKNGELINSVRPPSVAGSPENTFHAVTVSPFGKYIATECNGVIILYNAHGNLLWTYSDTRGYVRNTGIGFSPNEKYLAIGFYELGVYVFDVNGSLLWKYTKFSQNVRVVRFISNKYIVVGTSSTDYTSGNIYVFSINGSLFWKYRTDGGISTIDTSEDGDYIAVGTEKSGIGVVYLFTKEGQLIWDYNTGNPVNNVKVSRRGEYVLSIGGSGFYEFDKEGNVILSYRLFSSGFYLSTSLDFKTVVFSTLSKIYFSNLSTKNDSTTGTSYSLLHITSTPSGATVYLNSTYKGVTPLSLNLSPGTYTLTLSKEDYQKYITNVTLQNNESKSISVTLIPSIGYLAVNSSPSSAKVYVNGTYIGTTPITANLSPGTYVVRLIREGYENYTTNVIVQAGRTARISPRLTPTSQTTTTSPKPTTTQTPANINETNNLQTTTLKNTIPKTTNETNLPYIAGALIGLLLLGSMAVKVKGKKSKSAPLAKSGIVKSPTQHLSYFPPELLDKYEPLEFLGEGGFAKVFKAKRKKDGKVIALKIPRIDEKTSKTFIKEVSTWLHLNHRNIVKLYDVDILPIPYLEMEFIEGVTVDGKVARDLGAYPKPVDEKTALKLIKGIASGLAHAHSKGIYHRDLKPLNILLKENLTPKITDWGLAKLGTMSSSRSVLGYTPLYAAPEHLMPSKYGHTDQRTDIWQLGVTFYELLTGKLPFEGYTYEEVFGKIVDESYRFTPPSKINPELAKYDGIFEKLLAKRKEERYQSVEEFLKDLDKLEEAERKKAELEKEVESLKRTLAKSMSALKESRSAEEVVRNRKLVVETLGKLALAYAELNRKAELLNTLNDLKFYTVQNLTDLTNAINTVELLIKENLAVSGDFIEKLKVLVHNIRRENGA